MARFAEEEAAAELPIGIARCDSLEKLGLNGIIGRSVE